MGLWINGVWGWGKTWSFVTWEFWGVLLPQYQYCRCHKYLCHLGPRNTHHFSFFLFLAYSRSFNKSNLSSSNQIPNRLWSQRRGSQEKKWIVLDSKIILYFLQSQPFVFCLKIIHHTWRRYYFWKWRWDLVTLNPTFISLFTAWLWRMLWWQLT